MKKITHSCRPILSLLFFLISLTAASQDFLKVDAVVAKYPKSFAKVEDFAAQIKKDFTREDEMARAAFTWIALNVVYDVKSYYSQVGQRSVAYSFKTQEEKLQKEKAFENELIEKTLRYKKAVCQGYATLFQRVCELNGIETVMVTGSAKVHLTDIGKLPDNSIHAWNAVKIDDKWQLLDPTWAAGAVDTQSRKFIKKFNPGYFFTDPDLFFLNHFPDDKNFLLTQKTEKDFADLPLYYRQYMESDYRFVTPENGVVSVKDDKVLQFKVANFSQDLLLTYAFSRNGQLQRIIPTFTNNTATFEIPLDAKSVGYLTLYINNYSAVAYKIQR